MTIYQQNRLKYREIVLQKSKFNSIFLPSILVENLEIQPFLCIQRINMNIKFVTDLPLR